MWPFHRRIDNKELLDNLTIAAVEVKNFIDDYSQPNEENKYYIIRINDNDELYKKLKGHYSKNNKLARYRSSNFNQDEYIKEDYIKQKFLEHAEKYREFQIKNIVNDALSQINKYKSESQENKQLIFEMVEPTKILLKFLLRFMGQRIYNKKNASYRIGSFDEMTYTSSLERRVSVLNDNLNKLESFKHSNSYDRLILSGGKSKTRRNKKRKRTLTKKRRKSKSRR